MRIENGEQERIMFIEAELGSDLPAGSTFASTEEVSDFFKLGNLGWSDGRERDLFDAIELEAPEWNMAPLQATETHSAYFSDESKFPKGSVEFDSAMIMRNLKHSWVSRGALYESGC